MFGRSLRADRPRRTARISTRQRRAERIALVQKQAAPRRKKRKAREMRGAAATYSQSAYARRIGMIAASKDTRGDTIFTTVAIGNDVDPHSCVLASPTGDPVAGTRDVAQEGSSYRPALAPENGLGRTPVDNVGASSPDSAHRSPHSSADSRAVSVAVALAALVSNTHSSATSPSRTLTTPTSSPPLGSWPPPPVARHRSTSYAACD